MIERDDFDSDQKLLNRVADWGPTVTPDRTAGAGPAFTGPIASKTPVVFLNSGADCHIGPHRSFVPLARECAAAGLIA